jgi:hypothetical protein
MKKRDFDDFVDMGVASFSFTVLLSFIVGIMTYICTNGNEMLTAKAGGLTFIIFLVVTGVVALLEYLHTH